MKKISITQLQTSRLAKAILFIITLTVVSVFAWSATWHGTDWVQSGKIITAKDLAENFEYLYQNKVDKPPSDCFGTKAKLQWKNNQWECGQLIPGCKLRYRIKTNGGTSDWGETGWGGYINKPDGWSFGPTVSVPGSDNSTAIQIQIMCDENNSFGLKYRIRNNRGHNVYGYAHSATNAWGTGNFTAPVGGSCDIKGGDGTCAIYLYTLENTGPIRCVARLKWNPWQGYGGEAFSNTGSGSYTGKWHQSTQGIRMGIKCSN